MARNQPQDMFRSARLPPNSAITIDIPFVRQLLFLLLYTSSPLGGVVNTMSFLSLSTARVAIAGDEPPLDNFVYDEHSDSQCGVMPPKLATCEYSLFGSPLLRWVSSPPQNQEPIKAQRQVIQSRANLSAVHQPSAADLALHLPLLLILFFNFFPIFPSFCLLTPKDCWCFHLNFIFFSYLASWAPYCPKPVYDPHSSLSLYLLFLLPSLYPPPAPLCCSVDEAVVEDQPANQSHSSGPETEPQSTQGHVEQGKRQDGVLEDGPSGLDLSDKTLPPHKEQKVSSYAVIVVDCVYQDQDKLYCPAIGKFAVSPSPVPQLLKVHTNKHRRQHKYKNTAQIQHCL